MTPDSLNISWKTSSWASSLVSCKSPAIDAVKLPSRSDISLPCLPHSFQSLSCCQQIKSCSFCIQSHLPEQEWMSRHSVVATCQYAWQGHLGQISTLLLQCSASNLSELDLFLTRHTNANSHSKGCYEKNPVCYILHYTPVCCKCVSFLCYSFHVSSVVFCLKDLSLWLKLFPVSLIHALSYSILLFWNLIPSFLGLTL